MLPQSLSHQQHQQGSAPRAKKRSGLLSKLFRSFNGKGLGAGGASSSRHGAGPAAWALSLQAAASATAPPLASSASVTSLALAGDACPAVPFFNYQTDIEAKYAFGRELGTGGNGVVRIVTNRETGEEFACKSIRKVLPPDASDKKRQGHLASIRREVQVLTRLRGSLNIVKLEDVFEDEGAVHIVMEACRGGELAHRIGDRHYSERTVASFMRAVLRTLAQCHAQHILHRDIKPGNFMLLSSDDRAPLKAIDFGLAVPFDPAQLPRTDLGLEGTPWYMAPETLRGDWLPASDVWAAGVMAYQLLCGRFPFDDKKNVYAPAITAVWRSVLNDPLDFSKPCWADISQEAKDFCRLLLNRDPAGRPSAKEALKHPWLRGDSAERSTGKRLGQSVVARIQRFAAASQFKRTVLQSIAAELLSHPQLLRRAQERGQGQGPRPRQPTGQEEEEQEQCQSQWQETPQERGRVEEQAASQPHGQAGEQERGCGGQEGTACGISASGQPVVPAPDAACLQPVLAQLRLDRPGAVVTEAQLKEALAGMGFRLAPGEASRLMAQVDLEGSGAIDAAAFAASQVDWRALQQDHAELWLQLAERAFRSLDTDGNGVLEADEILAALRSRLPAEEVDTAMQLALQEACSAGAAGACSVGGGFGGGGHGGGLEAEGGIDFDGFVSLLKAASVDSLDLYDDRMSLRSNGSGSGSGRNALGRANSLLAASIRSGDWSRQGSGLSADSSRHGCTSGVSPPQDRSQGRSQDRPKQAASAFRFDVGGSGRGDSSGSGKGKGGVAGQGVGKQPGAAAATGGGVGGGGGGGMVWRFDVGGGAAPPPPPPPSVVWRFDVGDGGGAASRKAEAVVAPAASATAGGGLGRRGHGGYCDRRMHGSDLYRNVALKALHPPGSRLHTVAEAE